MPEGSVLFPHNQLAEDLEDGGPLPPPTADEQYEFDAAVEEFFDAAIDKMAAGKISPDQVGELFPSEKRLQDRWA